MLTKVHRGLLGARTACFQVDCGVAHNGQVQRLAIASAPVSAEIVERPMDRVRGFVRLYRPQMCLVAGEIVADATPAAPYLRPPRELVRGAIEIESNDWAIGGAPASVRRRDDVRARAAAHQ